MSSVYNKLIFRQMRKYLGRTEITPELENFLQAVSASYDHYEKDRQLLERAMERSSAELLAKNDELSAKNDTLDSFVYRVSHDLKTPANNFVSMLHMLNEFVKPEDNHPMVGKILENLDAASRTMQVRISDLLEMTRIEHKLSEVPVVISLEEMVEEVTKSLNAEIEVSGAEIEKDFAEASHIRFGRENMFSILSNLIGNAIKYRSPEKPPRIQVKTGSGINGFFLSIQDNGLGMDLEKDGKRLFGMFSRMHSHVEGTGIGLFLVKKIVDNNQGQIEVKSIINHGTNFTISFPHGIIISETEVYSPH